MEAIRCRICDSALCVVDGGGLAGRAVYPGSSEVRLETDGASHYFRCPYCSARNITILTTSQDGRPTLQVAWAVMNGD